VTSQKDFNPKINTDRADIHIRAVLISTFSLHSESQF